jgi:ribonuclease HII
MSRITQEPLAKFYNEHSHLYEIGVDEAGRGPLLGRVYTAAVILPKDTEFDFSKMKDSKKFHSSKKINEVADYIKENALAWSVTYNDENVIDNINIRQAVLNSMHQSIKHVLESMNTHIGQEYMLLIDGNDFKPYINFTNNTITQINHLCIEGGDNKYCSIAAASILAKTERDKYIAELCKENPELNERYGLEKNKGYGTKIHIDGIKTYGISKWHRKSYGICKDYL